MLENYQAISSSEIISQNVDNSDDVSLEIASEKRVGEEKIKMSYNEVKQGAGKTQIENPCILVNTQIPSPLKLPSEILSESPKILKEVKIPSPIRFEDHEINDSPTKFVHKSLSPIKNKEDPARDGPIKVFQARLTMQNSINSRE